jgi:hypothetical protein
MKNRAEPESKYPVSDPRFEYRYTIFLRITCIQMLLYESRLIVSSYSVANTSLHIQCNERLEVQGSCIKQVVFNALS